MNNSVYLVSGEGLPTKLAVVALDLEPEILLSIENRFLRGLTYNTVTLLDGGVVRLAAPHFGPHDQAYFPSYDGATVVAEGGTDSVPADDEPGRVLQSDVVPEGRRRAYLVTRATTKATECMVVVLVDSPGLSAEAIVQALAMKPGAATLTAKLIGSGSFLVVPEIAQLGFRVCTGPAIQPLGEPV